MIGFVKLSGSSTILAKVAKERKEIYNIMVEWHNEYY